MAKNKDEYLVRKFLNGQKGMAVIQIEGNVDSGFALVLSDCYRAITLDFEYYGKGNKNPRKKAALKKLNLLISELEKAREFHFGTDE